MQIDHRRAYNCEIMLSKVKVPLHELMVSLIVLLQTFASLIIVDKLLHVNFQPIYGSNQYILM